MGREVLLFRLNLPKEKNKGNVNISLENTIKILKAQEENAYYILIENEKGFKIAELIGDITVSSLIEKVSGSSKIISTHIWAPRDPASNEHSARYYYPNKKNLLEKIRTSFQEGKHVYCIICDSDNNPYYLGKLIAYSENVKNFLSKIFNFPNKGEFNTAFFFSKAEFYNLTSLLNSKHKKDLGYIGEIIQKIENLCQKGDLKYPLKSTWFSKKKIEELTKFLDSKTTIEHQIDILKRKKEIAENFLKGKIIEVLAQIIFGELLSYKIQATGYENWAPILKDDVLQHRIEGNLSTRIRRLPDFYFSYNESTIPPLYYKGIHIKNGWLEIKYRTLIRKEDLSDWKNRHDPEVFLMIYSSINKKLYFIKSSDLPEIPPIPDDYLFEKALLPIFSNEVSRIMEDLLKNLIR